MKTQVTLIKKIPDPTLEHIEQAYIGTPDTCMCGCAGDYYTPQDNPAKVKLIMGMIAAGCPENINDYIFTRVIGARQYTIYLKRGG